MSYIKQLIEKYQKSAKRTIAGGLVALGVLTGSLTSCGNTNNIVDVDDTKDYIETVDNTKVTETSGDINFTESGNNQTGNQSGNQTETNQSNNQNETNHSTTKPTGSDITNMEERFAHSEEYNRAKQKWASIWSDGVYKNTRQGFLSKPVPFKFLEEQGVVYYNSQGEPRAYGTDENFDNVKSIQSKAWIDTNTAENDLYLLTQYISAPIDDSNSNDDTYVATYMLKYTVDDDCYRDLLLLSGDFRINLIIQEMDKEYTPEVISKSIIRYDLIKSLGLFSDLSNNGVNQPILDYNKADVANYVSNIDYNNMAITVNYNTKANKGDIYSYTYKLKESPYWDKVLVGSDFVPARTEEQRDALTPEQIMPTYSSNAGVVLNSAKAFAWTLSPSAEQKATASIKYDFVNVAVDASATSDKVNNYEAGKISYAEVNSLTRDYVNSLKSELTK